MVLSGNRKGSIKQTNTSQVLVSETVPDRRVQPSRRAKMTRFGDNPVTSTVSISPRRQPGRDTSTRNRRDFKLNVTDPDLLIPIKQTVVTSRHSDLREPQPSSSDSQPASLQPVSETTTSESSVSLPSSPSAAQAQRAPVQVAWTVRHLRHHLKAAHSHPRMLRAQRQAVQPAHHGLLHPNCLRWSVLSNSLLAGTRDPSRPSSDGEPNGQLERPTAAYRRTEASCQSAAEPTTARLSTSSCKHATSPVSPKMSK